MRDWIIGLRKSAVKIGEGLAPEALDRLEAEAGISLPEELRDLYQAMGGAELRPDVSLVPLRADSGAAGLPRAELWVFGTKAATEPLFAATRRAVREFVRPGEHTWLEQLGEGEFVFGMRTDRGTLRLYRSLEQLLARLVPPAETEVFGDITYARALTAVQGALDELEDEGVGVIEVTAPPRRKAAKSKAKQRTTPKRTKRAPKKGKAKR